RLVGNARAGAAARLLQVALDLGHRAGLGRVRVGTGLPRGPPLPQQVPALVESHFQLPQAVVLLRGVDPAGLGPGAQPVLLVDQLGDAMQDLLVVHGAQPFTANSYVADASWPHARRHRPGRAGPAGRRTRPARGTTAARRS